MKAISFLLFYFTSFALFGQDWTDYLTAKNQHEAFIEKIRKGTDWDSILKSTDTSLVNKYSPAIRETSLYLKSPMVNVVDSFFHAICFEWYSKFPYRTSGNLKGLLYNLAETDTSELKRTWENKYGKNLYPKVAHLVNKPGHETIPLLIEYLENHAATRLVVDPQWDFEDPSYYLCISDMALELIEIISWCDFHNNAEFPNLLFSKFPSADQDTLIATVRKWYKATSELPKNEAAAWFLDSICPYGFSGFTCENLLYHGDTLKAKRTYQAYYEKTNLPCRVNVNVGKILLTLGDRRVLEDCANKIMNYRCTAESGRSCVYILLDSNYPYVDEILGEVVSTEPHSLYRNQRSGAAFVWPTILASLGNYEKREMPVTLLALMQIDDDFAIGDLYSSPWNKKYGHIIKEGFRVCDLALLKYNDTIKPIAIQDWSNKTERDLAIQELLEEAAENKY